MVVVVVFGYCIDCGWCVVVYGDWLCVVGVCLGKGVYVLCSVLV